MGQSQTRVDVSRLSRGIIYKTGTELKLESVCVYVFQRTHEKGREEVEAFWEARIQTSSFPQQKLALV